MTWRMFVPTFPEDVDDGAGLDAGVIAGVQVITTALRDRNACLLADNLALRDAIRRHRRDLTEGGFGVTVVDQSLWDSLGGEPCGS
jgi:hypothetical protein